MAEQIIKELQEKNQYLIGKEEQELEQINYVRLYSLIPITMVQIAQFWMTFKFFIETRKIKDVGMWPRMMTLIANIPGILFICRRI